jgi:DEAD/DEAH box helicase domain-containing protein
MIEVVMDVETKKAFEEVGGYEPKKLGVSFAGICIRDTDYPERDKFIGYFEHELNKLWPELEKASRVIGFNILGFDYPVLSAYYPGDFSKFSTLDILEEVKNKVGHRVSLDAIAKQTIGVQKSGSGLDALKYFEQGKLKELAEYCLMDVRITRDIYDYGKQYRNLRFLNKWNRIVTVEVDFSVKSQESSGSELQMSLGV